MDEKEYCDCGSYIHDGPCDPQQLKRHQKWVKEWLIPHNKELDEFHLVPHEEIEVTVKFKMLVKVDDQAKLRAEQYARTHLFSRFAAVAHVEVTDTKINPLNDIDKIALPFYLRMEGWAIKHHRFWDIRYASHNSDEGRCFEVDDVDIKKTLGIRVIPLTATTAKINCMCLGGIYSEQPPLDIETTLERLPEDVFKAMKEHECTPCPG